MQIGFDGMELTPKFANRDLLLMTIESQLDPTKTNNRQAILWQELDLCRCANWFFMAWD
jgi:hypothetical protein